MISRGEASSPGPERFDTAAESPDAGEYLQVALLSELSYDVHDMWRSTLEPGDTTPFAPDVVEIQTEDGLVAVDLANTPPIDLPPAVKALSFASAGIVSAMVEHHIGQTEFPLEAAGIEKMATLLYGYWDVIKHNQALSLEGIDARFGGYLSEPERIHVLDRRLILAGFASLFDDARYPDWQDAYDMDTVRALPGVAFYAAKGQQILDEVRMGRPVPLGSPADNLYS